VALKEARNAFATTVDAWSKVEIFRFGPINEDHRFDRLFYWPDPKSIGLKQVQDALAHRDQAATLPYALQLANKGWKRALRENPALLKGLNMTDGHLTYGGVAEACSLSYEDPAKFVVE